MKIQSLVIIIVYILTISPQIAAMSCSKILNKSLTIELLGSAWRTAHWRNGMHPFRYYNSKAIKRVVEDPDLIPIAQAWITLSETRNDSHFLEQSYEYLIILGDLRSKLNISFEETKGKPKFMLWYLKLVLERYEKGGDVSLDIKLISKFLNDYTHPDGGFYMKKFEEGMQYFNENMMPRHATLEMLDIP